MYNDPLAKKTHGECWEYASYDVSITKEILQALGGFLDAPLCDDAWASAISPHDMNECLALGRAEGFTNVRVWVSGASAAGFTESMIYQQAGRSLGPMFNARERRRAGQDDAKHLFVAQS